MTQELSKRDYKGAENPIAEISAEEVHRIIKNGSRITLVDVREKDELDLGYLPGALSIPSSELDEKAGSMLPDKNTPIVTYCAGGVRSLAAAKKLKRMGYTSVVSMAKGFNGWLAAGYDAGGGSELRPDQLDRYSRHLLLKQIGVEGQSKLLKAKVLLVGAGGLGCPAGLYLAAAGVGTLGIIDSDRVDMTNLQRQILHGTCDVGRPKTESAKEAIARVNSDVHVVTFQERLRPHNAIPIFENFDVILDGSDNFPTKYLINDACYLAGKPNVYGGVFQFEGQASVFFPKGGGPCLRCLFPDPPPPGLVPS